MKYTDLTLFGHNADQRLTKFVGAWQTPLVKSADILEASEFDYVILRTTWLYNDPCKLAVDVSEKDQPFKDDQLSREAVAKFAADLLTGDQDYHKVNLRTGEPNTEWTRPSFY